MIEKEVVLRGIDGLHLRPAGVFVRLAAGFKSEIKILCGDQLVDGKSMLGLLTLGITSGTKFKLIISGEDEEQAMETLIKLIERNFENE